MNPELSARKLLKFLGLPWNERIEEYISTHTLKDDLKIVKNQETQVRERRHDPYGTSRNSSAVAFAWRQNMPMSNISVIQTLCREAMNILGYKIIKSEEELKQNLQLPLTKTAREVRP